MKLDYKVVLFDLDGTVIDSMEGILNSMNYAFRKGGMEELTSDELLPFIGPPIVMTLQLHFNKTEEEAEEIMSFYHEYYSTEGWKQFRLYPDVDLLISGLKEKKIRLGLATNKPRHYARQILSYLGLDAYFEYIGGSNAARGIVDKKGVIEDCITQMGVKDKAQVLMIGDRHYDAAGAKGAGIDMLGVAYGYGSQEELKEAGAVIVCDTAGAVLDFF